MKKIALLFPLILCSFSSCSSTIAAFQGKNHQKEAALDEMRLEVADLKHEVNGYQVELQILEDKLRTAVLSASPSKPQIKEINNRVDSLNNKLASVEKKLGSIEATQEKTLADLRSLSTHANEVSELLQTMEKQLHLEKERMDEMVKLKGNLLNLSKMVSKEKNIINYSVKEGDSLTKIAKEHGTTVDEIMQINEMETDKIIIGKELKIPSQQ